MICQDEPWGGWIAFAAGAPALPAVFTLAYRSPCTQFTPALLFEMTADPDFWILHLLHSPQDVQGA
jgi:hypothetical protein